jgi:hypothetical protein
VAEEYATDEAEEAPGWAPEAAVDVHCTLVEGAMAVEVDDVHAEGGGAVAGADPPEARRRFGPCAAAGAFDTCGAGAREVNPCGACASRAAPREDTSGAARVDASGA